MCLLPRLKQLEIAGKGVRMYGRLFVLIWHPASGGIFQEDTALNFHPITIVMIIILAILLIALAVLYFLGRKAQKKQEEQQEAIDAAKQVVSMLVIDKKRMKLKEAGLPAIVLENTPRLLRGSKVPIVKAKVGPQILTFICEESIFETIPVKKEVKATISGLYITDVRGLRGKLPQAPAKKKSKFTQWKENLQSKAGAKPL